MSARKVYDLNVSGKVVFSGSYSSVMNSFYAVRNTLQSLFDSGVIFSMPVVSVSFTPGISYLKEVSKDVEENAKSRS